MRMLDIRELDRRAVDYSIDLVARLTPADLDRPTPCAAWNLRDLLAHMTAQHHGFAAAAQHRGGDPDAWLERPLTDPIADYTTAAKAVLAAFAAPDALTTDFEIPGFAFLVPGQLAVGFHFIDYLVHGWDVATTLGLAYDLDPELAQPGLEIALAVPGGDYRLRPGAAFGPELPTESTGILDRILMTLGRNPADPIAAQRLGRTTPQRQHPRRDDRDGGAEDIGYAGLLAALGPRLRLARHDRRVARCRAPSPR